MATKKYPWNQYNHPWTNGEINLIKKNYSLGLKGLIKLLPLRSYSAIRIKANKMNLFKINSWTKEEFDILKENYNIKSNKELHILIPKHSIFSINTKLHKMKLNREENFRKELFGRSGLQNKGKKRSQESINKQITKFKSNLSLGIIKPSQLGVKQSQEWINKSVKSRIKTFLENPEIMKRVVVKRNLTLKNNPEIIKKANQKRSILMKTNPERYKNLYIQLKRRMNISHLEKERVDKIKRTLLNKYAHNKVYSNCIICNKKIVNSKTNNYKKNFCSIKCARAKQIFPIKDSSIEIKIQNFLKELGIEYFTHQYIKIEHGYQCDILIPSMNLVIECDGNYWHSYPTGKEIDHIRTKELLAKGFKVLRLWEFEINDMTIKQFKEKLQNV